MPDSNSFTRSQWSSSDAGPPDPHNPLARPPVQSYDPLRILIMCNVMRNELLM